jgi:INO80 complex subunit C
VKKNVKQILTLERERVSGGDGFLTASQTAARARGEVVESAGSKKKKTGPGAGGGGVNNLPNKRGFNLKNRKSGGTNTPLTQDGVLESGQTTPNTGNNVDDDGEGEDEEEEGVDQAVKGDLELHVPHKEVITCESGRSTFVLGICSHRSSLADHTPAAPPSLLPAKKYCDITGLHANYTDPRTKLRYKGLDVWHVVRSLVRVVMSQLSDHSSCSSQGPGSDQAYLALRGAQTSLK